MSRNGLTLKSDLPKKTPTAGATSCKKNEFFSPSNVATL